MIVREIGERSAAAVRSDFALRGDANGDHRIDIADAIYVVYHVLPGTTGGYSLPCRDAGDANDDEAVNLADTAYLINYQFRGGPAPPNPIR